MKPFSRGFTLVELSVVTTILALVVPSTLLMWRTLESRDLELSAQLAFTASVRTASEELRRDLHAGAPVGGLVFRGEATCGDVTYVREDDGTFVRKTAGCGQRFVASDVEKVEVTKDLVRLSFARRTGIHDSARAVFAIGLPGVKP